MSLRARARATRARLRGTAALGCAVAATMLPGRSSAETAREEQLRVGEAETAEPHTDEPLKAALQNLFLQEDAFPQQHLELQTGLRTVLNEEEGELEVSAAGLLELGLGDSWTVSLRAPVSLLTSDDRGLGNVSLSVLYSLWVSRNENLRLTAFVESALPSPVGEHAVAHDASVVGYLRLAPVHLQAVATLDVSYGRDIPGGPRARPEGALAAIVKLDDYAVALEATAQREFQELRYLAALGGFWYPDDFEVGVAVRADLTQRPISFGGIGLVSYTFPLVR